jgi:anti-sigma regulatory factor (Ser/Thr protein kinase)
VASHFDDTSANALETQFVSSSVVAGVEFLGEVDGCGEMPLRAARTEEADFAAWQLPPSKRAARIGRGLVRRYASEPDETAVTDLIVSELVSNALDHGALPIYLAVACEPCWLTITVHDAGTRPWRARSRPAAPDEERGRGLMLIEALADSLTVSCGHAGTFVEARVRRLIRGCDAACRDYENGVGHT